MTTVHSNSNNKWFKNLFTKLEKYNEKDAISVHSNRNSNKWFINLFTKLEKYNEKDAILDGQSLFNLLKFIRLITKDSPLMINSNNNNNSYNSLIDNINPSKLYDHVVLLFVPDILLPKVNYAYIEEILNKQVGIGKWDIMAKPTNEKELEIVNNTIKNKFECHKDENAFDQVPSGKYTFYCKAKFNNNWLVPFDPKDTKENEMFYLPDDKHILVTMMNQYDMSFRKLNMQFNKLKCKVYQIPYVDRQSSMFVILPDKPVTPQDLTENILKHDDIPNIIRKMKEEGELGDYDLQMPKFTHKEQYNLDHTFKKIPDLDHLLQPLDISKIFDNKKINKGPVLASFKTIVSIKNDEIGTQIESKTICDMVDGSFSYSKISINKPFVYFICDENKEQILFIGTFTGIS